ncbi:MAG: PilZ domain-containing protein [Spirochaetaceae bacterium]|nr:PilZ domain-containing protein [Spirochaetaceae bacterium]
MVKNNAAQEDPAEILGKKIFFIHPSMFVQNEIINQLIQQEYEVYVARDEEKLQRALKKFPHSIVLASIDETLSANKWEEWIRQLMTDKDSGASVGVLSNTNNDEARRTYLNKLKVPCGFVPLKVEKTKTLQVLLDILTFAKAKGRRKYIRADTRKDAMATINIPRDNAYLTGDIRDISAVGVSCVFPPDVELEKNSLLPDIQLKLQGSLLKVEGIVFGFRMEEANRVYVFLFTPKTDPLVRTKIRAYIQKNLQSKMDADLK